MKCINCALSVCLFSIWLIESTFYCILSLLLLVFSSLHDTLDWILRCYLRSSQLFLHQNIHRCYILVLDSLNFDHILKSSSIKSSIFSHWTFYVLNHISVIFGLWWLNFNNDLLIQNLLFIQSFMLSKLHF